MNHDRKHAAIRASHVGDAQVFALLVHEHGGKLFRAAYRITGHREDAEDVVQETLLRVYQKIESFQGKSQLSTWMTSIAVNQAISCLRKRNSDKSLSIDEPIAGESGTVLRELRDERPNPEQLVESFELSELLYSAIHSLPPGYKEVFVLYHINEHSIADTALALGVSVLAAKSRLLRARRQLGQRLAARSDMKSKVAASSGLSVSPHPKNSTLNKPR